MPLSPIYQPKSRAEHDRLFNALYAMGYRRNGYVDASVARSSILPQVHMSCTMWVKLAEPDGAIQYLSHGRSLAVRVLPMNSPRHFLMYARRYAPKAALTP